MGRRQIVLQRRGWNVDGQLGLCSTLDDRTLMIVNAIGPL
jgi:hypothetical protein